MPDDVSVEEIEAIVEECSSTIGAVATVLNSVLRAVRNDALPKETIDRMRMAIHDMLSARMTVDNAIPAAREGR